MLDCDVPSANGSTPAPVPHGTRRLPSLLRERVTGANAAVLISLTLILLCAAVLRLDALAESFGPHDAPRWLGALERVATRASEAITPDGWGWQHEADPYGRGDPHNYLRFAREMRHFYQAHVREPVYLVAVRAGLVLSGGADVGISITSIASSLLLLVVVYVLGRETVSAAAGLLAAGVLAIERDAILWSIGGWRAETFACVSLLAVWLWVRTTRTPSTRWAAAAGLMTGLACLTRLTAPFMLAPVVVWTLCVRDVTVLRQRLRTAAIAGTLAAVIVTPYLVSCALEFGDPFYAVNYHTQFYLDREGSEPEIQPASRYILHKFADRPVETTDIALQGLFVFPFQNKWNGIRVWQPELGTWLAWLSVCGLLLWLFDTRGRVLLAALFGSLVPYMITWSIPGGAEWRFTSHAYVFYLLAAFGLPTTLLAARRQLAAARHAGRALMIRVVVLAAVVGAGLTWWWGMPRLVLREALRQNRPAAILAGPRDRWLLHRGWSVLSVTGNVTARFATAPSAFVSLPLPEQRDYQLVLRVDPIPRGDLPPQHLSVELDGEPLGRFELTWDPDAVGRYEVAVPGRLIRSRSSVLRLQPDALVEAGSAALRYPVLRPDERVGFRLWYVLIQPLQ